MMEHMQYGPLGFYSTTDRPWINLAASHDKQCGTFYTCTAHTFDTEIIELGERVSLAQDEECLGMGALFDLSYEAHLAASAN